MSGAEIALLALAVLSLRTGLPAAFVRKAAKSYGTERLAEGIDVGGRQVLLIEDVVTTGGQIVESLHALRDLGAVISHTLCVIDRESGGKELLAAEGVQLRALLTRRDIERAES